MIRYAVSLCDELYFSILQIKPNRKYTQDGLHNNQDLLHQRHIAIDSMDMYIRATRILYAMELTRFIACLQ